MSLRHHGTDLFGRLIGQNIEQARYLAALVDAAPELELLAPVELNVVCYRLRFPGLTDDDLDALNEETLLRIQESGFPIPSSTRIGGRFSLRVAITNHRSHREDFDMLVRETIAIGRTLAGDRVADPGDAANDMNPGHRARFGPR